VHVISNSMLCHSAMAMPLIFQHMSRRLTPSFCNWEVLTGMCSIESRLPNWATELVACFGFEGLIKAQFIRFETTHGETIARILEGPWGSGKVPDISEDAPRSVHMHMSYAVIFQRI
jgi:hypothetical protein